MSQHICNTTYQQRPVRVTIGYDRPLNYIHMIVMRTDASEDEDDFVYNNLDDDDAGTDCQDVDYFRRILESLAIVVPESMFAETLRDQTARIGNRVVTHTSDVAQ